MVKIVYFVQFFEFRLYIDEKKKCYRFRSHRHLVQFCARWRCIGVAVYVVSCVVYNMGGR